MNVYNNNFSLSNLASDEELILKDQKGNKIISFDSSNPPKIYDTFLSAKLNTQGGVYAPLYAKKEFKASLVDFNDSQFFDAFKKAFPDFTKENHYRWEIEKKQ